MPPSSSDATEVVLDGRCLDQERETYVIGYIMQSGIPTLGYTVIYLNCLIAR